MTAADINIDLSNTSARFGKLIRNLIRKVGLYIHEVNHCLEKSDQCTNHCQKVLIFLDLHVLMEFIFKLKTESLGYRVRKDDLYFFSLIRSRTDEKYADLIDDAARLLDNRLSVVRFKGGESLQENMGRLSNELQKVYSRNFSPDALRRVAYIRTDRAYMVEFNDGICGKVTLSKLGLDNREENFLVSQPLIGEYGDSMQIFTLGGEPYEIDAWALKGFIHSGTQVALRRQAVSSAIRLGARVRSVRKEKGITQIQLSQSTKIDQAIISKLERGRHIPRFDTLDRIAKGLNLSAGDLLTGC